MIPKITQRTHNNIISAFSQGKYIFPVIPHTNAEQVIAGETPVIIPITKRKDIKTLFKFFFSSYHNALKNCKDSEYNYIKKLTTLVYTLFYNPTQHIIEIIKQKDKILGFYFLFLPKESKYMGVYFMAVNSEIKNTRMSVLTLLNIGKRISFHAHKNNRHTICWEVDLRNQNAQNLYKHMPYSDFEAKKKSKMGKYTMSLKKFDKILRQFLPNKST